MLRPSNSWWANSSLWICSVQELDLDSWSAFLFVIYFFGRFLSLLFPEMTKWWRLLQSEQGTQNARTVARRRRKPANVEATAERATQVQPRGVGARVADEPTTDGPDVCISTRVVEMPRSGAEPSCNKRALYFASRKQESQLPLTDPRDADAQRMLNIPYHIIW